MSVVDLLELVRRLGIVGILVGVELQCQFPERERERITAGVSAELLPLGRAGTPYLYDLLMSSVVATFSTPSTW